METQTSGVLQGDTFVPHLFIICLDYELWTLIDLMKENGFTLKKARSRQYPKQTITDVDYADDIALLANTPTQAESLLNSLEKAPSCIGLHVNENNTEFMCFNPNQTRDISTKLEDKFTYLGSSVSSTEKDINTRRANGQLSIGYWSYGSQNYPIK